MQNDMVQEKNLMRNIARVALVTVVILSIPLIAMQFTSDVDWNAFDFVIMGILIFGTGTAYELVTWKIRDPKHRLILAGLFAAALFLMWAELAVGIFGSPFAGS